MLSLFTQIKMFSLNVKKIKLNHNYQTDIISLWKVEHIIDNHDECEFDLITTTPPLHTERML